jgi:hypothetical protein
VQWATGVVAKHQQQLHTTEQSLQSTCARVKPLEHTQVHHSAEQAHLRRPKNDALSCDEQHMLPSVATVPPSVHACRAIFACRFATLDHVDVIVSLIILVAKTAPRTQWV